MNDLISRQAAIEVARKCSIKEVTPAYRLIDKAEVMTELMMLPSSQPEQQWIPCSERLPGREWVLCKCRANIHEVLSLRDGYWYHDPQHHYMSGFVTHWMPLPEPPKGE